ncbi:MAG TPA: efflux RND transporter periplasmic adaptor subunit [Candidatus Omnitrophota bacterium]|nr:efflux RND transporter periplasmic adaptor subunit [Candidatus Omnitrophota bacterium]
MKPFRKNILIAIGAVILIIGGISLWPKSQNQQQPAHKDIYYCPMHPTFTSDKPGTCPICQMKFVKREMTPEPTADSPATLTETKGAVKKILYWTDPMIPGYKVQGPGKSPMGMDLVPVYEEEQAGTSGTSVEGHAAVSLTYQKQQLIGVKTEKVNIRQLTKTIRAVGTVAHDTELYQIQAEYLQTKAALKNAELSGFQEIIEQAQAVVDTIRLRLIHMGFHDGLIEELIQRGEPDQSLLLVETGPVWVYAKIYQHELPYVDVGTPAKVDVPSFSQETFEGMVRAVGPMVDMTTRTVRVYIQIKDAKGVLKPDMFVNVFMDIDLGQILAVPQDAVIHTGDKDVVFVDSGKGIFQPRQVTLGAETKGYFEIKSGLKQDEVVVTSGNFLIDSESRLKAAIEDSGDTAPDTKNSQTGH